jgi:cell division protein FtsB
MVVYSFDHVDVLVVPVSRRILIWPEWLLKGPVSRRILIWSYLLFKGSVILVQWVYDDLQVSLISQTFFLFVFAFCLSPVCHYFIVYILWIMFTFYFVTLFISLPIQYVNVLIKFKPKDVFNVEKPITHIYG